MAAITRTSTLTSSRGADRQERVAFENPQQLGLAFERQFADFVEKQRAQVGLLEEARVVAVGAGE